MLALILAMGAFSTSLKAQDRAAIQSLRETGKDFASVANNHVVAGADKTV